MNMNIKYNDIEQGEKGSKMTDYRQYFDYKDGDFDCNDHLGENPVLDTEPLIAFKAYDSCRSNERFSGTAKAVESVRIGDRRIKKGTVIEPPRRSAAVGIDGFGIERIAIAGKRPNKLRRCFWDIDIEYVLGYGLNFYGNDGRTIGAVRAESVFNQKTVLFGSHGLNYAVCTDLGRGGKRPMFDARPFVLVEAKAASFEAELCTGPGVTVVIDLFTAVTVFRIVDLSIESGGICVSNECEES